MANSGIHVFQSLAISPTEDSKCGLIFLHFYLVRFIVKTHVTLSPWSFLLLREEIFADWLCISKGEKNYSFSNASKNANFKFQPFFILVCYVCSTSGEKTLPVCLSFCVDSIYVCSCQSSCA